MKWPIVSVFLLLMLILVSWAFPEWSEIDAEFGYPVTWFVAMLFPISIGVAILRHRLFDIDILINRTLVYGALTALIIMLYVFIIAVLGGLVQMQTNVLSGLVATGIIAVIFHPLRERLQRTVNHILYGEFSNPAAVFSQFAYHLQTADMPAAILPNLVQTIALTLKIPYVAILLPRVNDHMVVAAEWGQPVEKNEKIALIYQNKTIGYLIVATRSDVERFSTDERALLATIAALTATTVRAVQLSDELRQSRQRIVTAREEERRRIRRDLHDGLGPQLASQTLGLEAVSQLMSSNPDKAQMLLQSLKEQAHEAILDVRRLVYDLRPPALDDLGLVGALKQSATRYETDQLYFHFDIAQPLPQLPAAVEIAAFRIAQEAMTNVVRHANATSCMVRLGCKDGYFIVEVCDNGRGLNGSVTSGVGLQSMAERAAELNGTCVIQRIPEGGTRVQAAFSMEVYHE